MTLAFNEFARHLGLDATHHVLLVLDQAGFHTGAAVILPTGLHITFLPSHSPELQPAERLWDLSDEPLANKCFDQLEKLTDVLSDRYKALTSMQQTIKSLCIPMLTEFAIGITIRTLILLKHIRKLSYDWYNYHWIKKLEML